MKSLRSILINAIILTGLGVGITASAMRPELPKIQIPVNSPSSSSSIWATMGNGLLTAAYHPMATSAVLAGLGGLYLGYCRKNSKNFTNIIKQAQSYTQFLDNPHDPAKPRNEYKYWNLSKGSSSDIAEFDETYYQMILDKKDNDYISDNEFIKFVRTKLRTEKVQLLLVRNNLHEALKECNILPRIKKPAVTNQVSDLIENYRSKAKRDFIKLTKAEFNELDTMIQKIHKFSLFNPRIWHRFIALPYESELIEQYWKIYQMIAHLDALEFCIDENFK